MDFFTLIIDGIKGVFAWPIWLVLLAILKIIGGLLTVVLSVAIVYLVMKSGAVSDTFDETHRLIAPNKKWYSKFSKKWKKVRNLLKDEHETYWKLAVIEADTIFMNLITSIGYPGKTIEDKLNNIKYDQISTIDEIKKAHNFKNEFVSQPALGINQQQAEEMILIYEKALKELDALD
jgi:hypothetical protein